MKTHLRCLLFALLCALVWNVPLTFATLASDTVWEVRPTNGDNTFGACYAVSLAGGSSVDYSQQNSAQLSLTDLATTGVVTTLTSVTGGFTDAMIGNCIRINSGTNFTVGWYQIITRVDTNTVTLDRAPSTGVGSSGAGKVGGATKTLTGQSSVTLMNSSNSATSGHHIYVKNEAWNEAVSANNDGAVGNPIIIEGYNTTRGDEPTGSNRPRNNKAGSGTPFNIAGAGNTVWKHLWGSNGASVGWLISVTNILVNVRASNNGTDGFSISSTNVSLINCESDNNSGKGIDSGTTNTPLYIIGCYIHNNTSTGISHAATGLTLVDSIITANGSHGVAFTNNTGIHFLVNNTIDANTGGSTDGVNIATGIKWVTGSVFMNNIISNNGRDGVRSTDATSIANVAIDYNNFYGNAGTARTNFPTGSHDIALDPQYVSTSGGNYAVGPNMRNVGFPGVFPASTTQGFLTIGAAQSPFLIRGGGGACVSFQ